jgi:electron transfer flavoprotein beta subunit
VHTLLAERLGIPQLSGARTVSIEGGTVEVERRTGSGHWALEAPLPAIVSTRDTINGASLLLGQGDHGREEKPVESRSPADLDMGPSAVGLASATSQVVDFGRGQVGRRSASPRRRGRRHERRG